mmetsp:Transcript_19285/g.18432  ORF Transcript_19285/g.18432 Transcript_19285/m.18432 type:complete len:125 (+) Transcript_19285:277-651(+)|eukprot:CAMPEP_0170550430 /NCGR_PEP_ID=MMETSP0211-20121228/8496_1 /TAXON_ID=311385 /ORGANISM="Pseudokeronopsis sp., Strain OXSARD2" /LENGTH=124 /DNA_ID=CAMNT_0010856983 /DNA_START=652 /DNA_END=1026 /DNA_ORIENTATION=+
MYVKQPKLDNDVYEMMFNVSNPEELDKSNKFEKTMTTDKEIESDIDLNIEVVKAQHGHIMQSLYSQPSKMIKLKPGVNLSEKGKVIQGPIYNFPNQTTMKEYQKEKSQGIDSISQMYSFSIARS